MKQAIKLEDMDVVVLCGGRGVRLQSVVNDRPKPMAEIEGSPLLDILINYVAAFGFRRFILCTGYMNDFISRYYRTTSTSLDVLISHEKEPLGTGGAVRNALPLIESSPFLAVNGDSLCRVDLKKFVDFHVAKEAMCCVVLAKGQVAEGCGVVELNGATQEVTGFKEPGPFLKRQGKKTKAAPNGYVNAGIYLFDVGIFSLMPDDKKFSLERDLFPKIVNKRFYGYATGASLIDIGTPKRYEEAKVMLKELKGFSRE